MEKKGDATVFYFWTPVLSMRKCLLNMKTMWGENKLLKLAGLIYNDNVNFRLGKVTQTEAG